jgi:hypothetical protein
MDSVEWMTDESRAPWVTNSLEQQIANLRGAARRLRKMFNKPYMGEMAAWLADAYEDAAAVLESRLGEINCASPSP